MTLEQAINHALERGEFVHLSVYCNAKGKFEASFTAASRPGGISFAEAADPIVAMVRAITSTSMVRKPAKTEDTYTQDQDAGLANALASDDPALQ
jgi:hypothetical protein